MGLFMLLVRRKGFLVLLLGLISGDNYLTLMWYSAAIYSTKTGLTTSNEFVIFLASCSAFLISWIFGSTALSPCFIILSSYLSYKLFPLGFKSSILVFWTGKECNFKYIFSLNSPLYLSITSVFCGEKQNTE